LAGQAAAAVLACVPDVMREIRRAMRQAAPAGVSVPQFRALIFAQRHPQAAVGELAAHLGVTLPTASVTVARLAREGWLQVDESLGDRRRRLMVLTPAGQALVHAAWTHTLHHLADRLAALAPAQLAMLGDSLNSLRGLWPASGPAPGLARLPGLEATPGQALAGPADE
jgi:DNA-binding MarR family transcriptional regulator